MAAAALAGELHLPLFTVVFDALITRLMSETAAKLRLVFDALASTRVFICLMNSTRSARGALNEMMSARYAAC
jgi:hypothetical protein